MVGSWRSWCFLLQHYQINFTLILSISMKRLYHIYSICIYLYSFLLFTFHCLFPSFTFSEFNWIKHSECVLGPLCAHVHLFLLLCAVKRKCCPNYWRIPEDVQTSLHSSQWITLTSLSLLSHHVLLHLSHTHIVVWDCFSKNLTLCIFHVKISVKQNNQSSHTHKSHNIAYLNTSWMLITLC